MGVVCHPQQSWPLQKGSQLCLVEDISLVFYHYFLNVPISAYTISGPIPLDISFPQMTLHDSLLAARYIVLRKWQRSLQECQLTDIAHIYLFVILTCSTPSAWEFPSS